MLTNFKELKAELLVQDPYGMRFSSDTDTEVVAKMAQSIYQQNLAGGNSISLREIVEQICLKLVRQGCFSTFISELIFLEFLEMFLLTLLLGFASFFKLLELVQKLFKRWTPNDKNVIMATKNAFIYILRMVLMPWCLSRDTFQMNAWLPPGHPLSLLESRQPNTFGQITYQSILVKVNN